jgi:hypothetical protein
LFKYKAKENEGKNSISHHHFSLPCIRSSIFFPLLFSKTVHLSASFSRFLFLSFSIFLSLSLVQFVLAFPLMLSSSSHFIRGHAKVNKNSNSTPIVTTAAHHHFQLVCDTYARRKKPRTTQEKMSRGNYVSLSRLNMPYE